MKKKRCFDLKAFDPAASIESRLADPEFMHDFHAQTMAKIILTEQMRARTQHSQEHAISLERPVEDQDVSQAFGKR